MNMPANPSNSQKALQAAAQTHLGQLPAIVQQAMQASKGRPSDELGAGITSGFAIVSLRGKVWRIKHRGEERPLMAPDNNGQLVPRYSLEVVMVKASENIAKIFYENGYTEGSTAPPDCWSANGRVPDPASPALQKGKTGPTCVGCWANAWGSRINNTNNSKGKACADSKRVAIVPLEDIDNDLYGGPMLLRIPPASLGDLKAFSDKLNIMGYPYYAVATRISFDMAAEFPKLIFGAMRVLTAEEVAKVFTLRGNPATGTAMDPRLERILDAPLEHVETDGVDKSHLPSVEQMFEQPPVAAPIPQQVNAQAEQYQAPPVANTQAASPNVAASIALAPQAAPVQAGPLPEGWTELPGGKYYHQMHGLTDVRPVDEPEEEEASDPQPTLIALPDGNFYNPATGEVVKAGGATAAPAPEKPKRTRKAKEAAPAEPAPLQAAPAQDNIVDAAFQEVPAQAEAPETPPSSGSAAAPAGFDDMLDSMIGN